MINFELLSLILSFLTLLTISIAAAYAAKQLRHASRMHRENHDWNRRLATQEALRAYDYSLLSSALQKEFDYLNVAEPIALKPLQSRFSEIEDLQPELHKLLNFYEALARGINQGVFDEEVVKMARKNAMLMAEQAFMNYIENRRSTTNQFAWRELSAVVARWRHESREEISRATTDS